MEEYITLGHTEAVPECDLPKPAKERYYVPIHMVTKETSTTTKHRPVFDASSKSSNGVFFNDLLLPGPSLYPLLSTLNTQFHLHNVAFTGDISKMFHGIHLSSNDRDYLFTGSDGQISRLPYEKAHLWCNILALSRHTGDTSGSRRYAGTTPSGSGHCQVLFLCRRLPVWSRNYR